jgi:hypothetical protein
MGTTKKDKEFIWLKVLHLIDDTDTKDISKVHKLLKQLNEEFSIKERVRTDNDKVS